MCIPLNKIQLKLPLAIPQARTARELFESTNMMFPFLRTEGKWRPTGRCPVLWLLPKIVRIDTKNCMKTTAAWIWAQKWLYVQKVLIPLLAPGLDEWGNVITMKPCMEKTRPWSVRQYSHTLWIKGTSKQGVQHNSVNSTGEVHFTHKAHPRAANCFCLRLPAVLGTDRIHLHKWIYHGEKQGLRQQMSAINITTCYSLFGSLAWTGRLCMSTSGQSAGALFSTVLAITSEYQLLSPGISNATPQFFWPFSTCYLIPEIQSLPASSETRNLFLLPRNFKKIKT